ncbi:MAG: SpoIIE family protein phosphatase [Acidimicrobiales bacterium]
MSEDPNLEHRLPFDQASLRLIDQLPLVVWVHDATGAQVFVNQTFCDYFGVTRDEMRDDRWSLLTHPDDGTAYADDFAEAVAQQRPFHHEVRVRRGDGEWRWLESWGTPRFDADGSYQGHIGTSADITDRRSAERALADTAAFTDRVLDGLFTFAGVLDVEGVVMSANRAPLEAAGLDLDDVVGKHFWACHWWSYDDAVAGRIEQSCRDAAAGMVVRYDAVVRIRDDGRLPIDFQIAPLRGPGGGVTHLVVSGLDLTDRVQAQATELAARRKSEALESIASGLAAAATVEEASTVLAHELHDHTGGAVFVSLARDGEVSMVASAGGSVESWTAADDLETPAQVVASTGHPLRIPSGLAFDERFPHLASARRAVGFESLVVKPITTADGTPLGAVEAMSPVAGWFDLSRRALLRAASQQAGGAFERALLHERERRARDRAELIASTLTTVEAVSSVNEQVEVLTELLVPRIADFVTIEDPDSEHPLLAMAHVDPERAVTLASLRRWHRLENRNPWSLHGVAHGEARLVPNVDADPSGQVERDHETATLLDQLAMRSYVAVPLSLGVDRHGVLLCGMSDPERRRFDDDDLRLLYELAYRVGAVINATASREQEHESSLRLQHALLPDQVVEHPTIDTAARYQAASVHLEVGGDWYDTLCWDDGSYGVVVGDVVGHGIEAAAAMGRLRAASGILFASGPPDPSVMLETLDRFARGPDGTEYLTAFCAVVDPNTNRLSYASAGHLPALVVSQTGETRWLDQAQSIPISAIEVERRRSASVELAPDDTVIIYTDGLVERRGRDLHEAIGALAERARSLIGLDIEHLNQQLVSGVPLPAEDDVVVVSLRYAPTGNRFRATINAQQSKVAALREDLDAWLANGGVDEETRYRVVLGTSEACANAIEHGYSKIRSGRVHVRAAETEGTVQVIVSDAGRWHERRTQLPHRGRGTHIMESVATSFERHTSTTGTTVTLVFEP